MLVIHAVWLSDVTFGPFFYAEHIPLAKDSFAFSFVSLAHLRRLPLFSSSFFFHSPLSLSLPLSDASTCCKCGWHASINTGSWLLHLARIKLAGEAGRMKERELKLSSSSMYPLSTICLTCYSQGVTFFWYTLIQLKQLLVVTSVSGTSCVCVCVYVCMFLFAFDVSAFLTFSTLVCFLVRLVSTLYQT